MEEEDSSLMGLAGGCCFDFSKLSEHLFLVSTTRMRGCGDWVLAWGCRLGGSGSRSGVLARDCGAWVLWGLGTGREGAGSGGREEVIGRRERT